MIKQFNTAPVPAPASGGSGSNTLLYLAVAVGLGYCLYQFVIKPELEKQKAEENAV